MTEFMSWKILSEFVSFVGVVFMVVEFTKELPVIKKIPTKYWAFIISLLLVIIVNIQAKSFEPFDIVLYILSSITVGMSSNGLYNFNKYSKPSEMLKEEHL